MPDSLVDVERRVAVRFALEAVKQLLLDRLLEVRGGEGLALADGFSAVELLLDTDELGSGVGRVISMEEAGVCGGRRGGEGKAMRTVA